MDTRDELRFDAPLSVAKGAERGLGMAAVLRAVGIESAPPRFERFELEDKLGEGAMGQVFLARDMQLDRYVALKVLRDQTTETNRARLRREARALARLSHPNVVQVLGVGEQDAQTWIAMEYVPGITLAQWAKKHPPASGPRFDQALRLLMAAGRGLVAAHAAGMVHRDFKPANVLVGDDEAVKVADFGLAQLGTPPESELELSTLQAGDVEATADALTQTGVVAGTPRYMSPEQHRGQRADETSDQFAFAVSAWEVLHGSLPFPAASSYGLVDAMEAHHIAVPAAGHGVPRSVSRALRRAMSPDPRDRFPSMEALLSALPPRRFRRARLWALGALTVTMSLGLANAAWRSDGPACDASLAHAELSEVWNQRRRHDVRQAVVQTRASYAQTTLQTAMQALDGFAQRWVQQRVAACEAAWHERSANGQQLDARIHCLRRQLITADGIIERLSTLQDRRDVERAATAPLGLPDPQACETSSSRLPIEFTPRARSLRDELADIEAAWITGDHRSVVQRARAVADEAHAQGLDLLRGDALYRLGSALGALGEPEAVQAQSEAYAIAVAHDDWTAAAERARHLAFVNTELGQLDDARRWLRYAESASQRHPTTLSTASILRTECSLLAAEGKYERALEVCHRSLGLAEEAQAPQRLRWQILSMLATVLHRVGRIEQAIEIDMQLRGEARAQLGDTHPRVGGMSLNIGTASQDAGLHEQALAAYQEAVRVFTAAYGPDSVWVVSALMNTGSLHMRAGHYAAAEDALLAALEAGRDREDDRRARVLHNLAELRRRQGRYDEALQVLQQVQHLETKLLELGHPQTAHTHHTLGNVLMKLDRLQDARRELDRALELRTVSPGSHEMAALQTSLSELAELQDEPSRAIQHAIGALRIYATLDVPPHERLSALVRAGALLAARGRDAEAAPYLIEAVAYDLGDDPQALRAQARARAALTRIENRRIR